MLRALSYVLPHLSHLSSSEWAPSKLSEGNCRCLSLSGETHALHGDSDIRLSSSPSLVIFTIILNLHVCVFDTALRNHGVSRADAMAVDDNLSTKVLVCLNCFGGHEALFISNHSSPSFDRGLWNIRTVTADHPTKRAFWRGNGTVMRHLIALNSTHPLGPKNTFICYTGTS